jgi:hypothetical protein
MFCLRIALARNRVFFLQSVFLPYLHHTTAFLSLGEAGGCNGNAQALCYF